MGAMGGAGGRTGHGDGGAQVGLTADGRVVLQRGAREALLHPLWLRNRSEEPGQIEPVSRQRLFTPLDVPLDLGVTGCAADGPVLAVSFTDGHTAHLDLAGIERALGWVTDPEAPPPPEPWPAPPATPHYAQWVDLGPSPADSDAGSGTDIDSGPETLIGVLAAFYRHGFVVLRNAPTTEGTVRRVCDRLGYISGNNFGWVFDVRADPHPTDLAYTPVALLAHTDQPYRQPVPGIQLLHCLRNDAPGGDSTLADGLAAAEALAAADPEAHRALVETEVEFRYDMGTDTVVGRDHILTHDRRGRFRQIRLNTKLDAPVPPSNGDLDAFYRGRRWLADRLDHPDHQLRFRLEPGDVLVMDNRRVLHGRTAFDPAGGIRHLQGAYIDHDGPDTRYRLAVRARTPGRALTTTAGGTP